MKPDIFSKEIDFSYDELKALEQSLKNIHAEGFAICDNQIFSALNDLIHYTVSDLNQNEQQTPKES